LAERIAERASGNPFFAEEIVRDLADRNVLRGERGAYTCADDAADVDVPATVQAAIAARIDRLAPDAKLALNAAAVVGLRFEEGLLAELADTTAMEPLLKAELIDQVSFTRGRSTRSAIRSSARWPTGRNWRRHELNCTPAGGVLETRDPESADENAALIAEHSSGGDLPAAFAWHMRAGAWLNFRDIKAGRLSWQRPSKWRTGCRPISLAATPCVSARAPCCVRRRSAPDRPSTKRCSTKPAGWPMPPVTRFRLRWRNPDACSH